LDQADSSLRPHRPQASSPASFLDGVLVEPGDDSQPQGDSRAGAASGFHFAESFPGGDETVRWITRLRSGKQRPSVVYGQDRDRSNLQRAARRPIVLADPDPTDDVVVFDLDPTDSIIVFSP
jgi:hypothetical protein